MTKTLFLHFGLHKTGTTSIQGYLGAHRDALGKLDFHVVSDIDPSDPGSVAFVDRTNCYQIAHAILRPRLTTVMRLKKSGARLDHDQSKRLAGSLNRSLHGVPAGNLVISSESFSFLRTAEERALLDELTDGFQLQPIGFFRDKATWMRSWRRQVERSGALSLADAEADPEDGAFDFSDSSWLLDHDAIRGFFGPTGHYLSYDEVLARDGNVIPRFLRILGIDPAALPSFDEVWLNRTLSSDDPLPVR